jgi:hypothetical protein
MTKPKNMQKGGRKQKQPPKTTAKKPNKGMSALDPDARRYGMLLKDPCNGPLVAQPGGARKGYLIRLQAFVTVGGTDAVVQFNPGANSIYTGGTGTSGGPFTMATATVFNFLTNNAQSFRPIAACLKARYVGAENARAGLLGEFIGPALSQALSGASINVQGVLTVCQKVSRIGEVQHEVRWVPSSSDLNDSYESGTTPSSTVGTNCVGVMFQGASTASSMAFEVVAVYEWFPGTVVNAPAIDGYSTSRNTVSDVLRTLGPIGSWAFDNGAALVMKSMAGAAGFI